MFVVNMVKGGGLVVRVTLLLCLFGPVGQVAAATEQDRYQYVINLELAERISIPRLPRLQSKYKVYHVRIKEKGKAKYRIRLGFFTNEAEAKKLLPDIKKAYPAAWVDRVKKYDQTALKSWLKMPRAKKIITPTVFLFGDKETAGVMEKARQAVANQNYPAAIKLYTKVISRGAEKYRRDAQEYLGVSREKNGQYAHAKAEYKEYLRLYPEGEGAERVKLRLTGLITALNSPRSKLKKSRRSKNTIFDTYGHLMEFYRYDRIVQNDTVARSSSLTTSFGFYARRRSASSTIKAQVTGDYLHDFEDTDDNRERLTSLFVDYANQPKTTSFRLGRQSHTRSGVLGRMDGVWADYQFHPEWKINYVAGHPVNLFESNSLQDNRTFQGVSMDIGPFNKYWEFNIFQIGQNVDGITDREAVGGEVRYIHPEFTYFNLVDYDTHFEEVNKFFIVTNWRFKDQKYLNITYDKGKAPYIHTSNALMGQGFATIAQMRATYTDAEIKQIARDRTADSTIINVSGSFPISKKYTVNLDFTLYRLSGTPESAGILGTQPTGDEYFYGGQIVGNGVMFKDDTLIGGVRISNGSSYDRVGYRISERLKLSKKTRATLGMYYETESRNNGAESTTIRPSFIGDYLPSRHLRLEMDLSYSMTNREGDTNPTKEEGLHFGAGLIYDF